MRKKTADSLKKNSAQLHMHFHRANGYNRLVNKTQIKTRSVKKYLFFSKIFEEFFAYFLITDQMPKFCPLAPCALWPYSNVNVMNFNWCLAQLCLTDVNGCDIHSDTNIYMRTTMPKFIKPKLSIFLFFFSQQKKRHVK